jgi:hypothetical protein
MVMILWVSRVRRRESAPCFAPPVHNLVKTYCQTGRLRLKIGSKLLFICLSPNYLQLRRWLYTLFLGIDANFRLKRLNVSTQQRDPRLNYGFMYVVEETKFKQYLKDYSDKITEDMSTCHNHDALKSASMRGGKGTAASGIGAIDCI